MKILQLTAHFSPNIGGVETHYDDLVKVLTKKGHSVFVLTYRPLTTKAKWRMFEKKRGLEIIRLPWIPGLFYKFVSYPLLEFLYLFPGLFVATPFILAIKRPNVVHAHGLVAGAVAVFWKKIFSIRTVVSTHSIYHFPEKGMYRGFVKWMFENADYSLGLSKQAANEIKKLGVDVKKVSNFTYWIDLANFRKIEGAKNKLGWKNKFVVLFVGRLVPEKGVGELLKAANRWNKNIFLAVAGFGPMESEVNNFVSKSKNIKYLGKVEQSKLPLYYSAADLLIVPSTHEEGFGRVILESLACGTPVIGSNRGAIPEAMDESVGKLINVTPQNIKKSVEYYYSNPKKLAEVSLETRSYAEHRYSDNNVKVIVESYLDKE